MAEDSPNYALGRLILEYIRAFLWPAVALIVVLVYQDDVRTLLQERQVDIFGLRIGERVEEIESSARAEISDIKALLEEQGSRLSGAASPQILSDVGAKLSSLERNLSREIASVQTVQAEPAPAAAPVSRASARVSNDRAQRAAEAERQGFEALIERDLGAARRAFEQARTIWPEYHNVAEISRLLSSTQAEPNWPELYRKILTEYSWGLPEDLRPALREGAALAYH
jgi:hypothetical protein